jgi:uncharacterized membrane protein YeaQ/YmgE (transglycosylase-associated protein family)
MNKKRAIYFGMFVGGLIGGYIPVLFGANSFSFASIVGNAVGAIIGIYVVFKLTSNR